MQLIRILLVWLWVAGAPSLVTAAAPEGEAPAGAHAAQAAGETHAAEGEAHARHSLPAHPVGVFQITGKPGDVNSGFWITNSMVITWGVALILIVFAQVATRNMKLVPSGAQNFLEWLVESLYEFLEGIIGADLVKKTFWFFATIFIFILFTNWAGLFPGVGTVGWNVPTEHGIEFRPWLRGGNADMNMTFSMAMIFFALWTIWALQANGVVGFFKHLFAPKGDTTGLLKVLMIFVFLAVGVLEVVSILFRPVSLSFRLFGNIFAGENMLETMAMLVPGWIGAVVVPIPFYFLELMVGLVQALVFMLLTAVFTMLICQHDEEHAPGKAHH